ncbi:MAG: DUF1800 domain-containing protein [Prosthecobacter sp.]|nr:DUF1800 domain-containing protein [Prosthecobacter sp.]
MKIARRDLLKSVAAGGGLAALTGCNRITSEINQMLGESVPQHLAVPEGTEIDPEFHLLSRAAFGPWPGDLERVKEMGRDVWIEEQLEPASISDTTCDFRAERFESLYFSAGDAYEFRKPVLRDELTRHALLRAIYSRRQLFEVMVEFWTDHLNIDLEKGDCIYLKPSDDLEVIRKHALGNFHDLIRASATSPAMLVYLDGKSNKVEKGKEAKPNENYARELMELHTMGVHGGYTQDDVREAARCLSGWTFDTKRFFALDQSHAFFKPNWHDNGVKQVLGQTIPAGGGPADLDKLVDIVCSHPSTARFIATKLCKRFVSQTPPDSLVQRVSAEFTRTRGDVKCLLRLILKSDEFMASRGQLLKRPFKFVVSALRAVAADTHADKGVVEPLQRMGHGLFQYPTPDGYPDEELPWMGTLMWRWNFALALAGGKQVGARVSLQPLVKALRQGKTDPDAATWFRHFVGRQPSQPELDILKPHSSLTKVASPKSYAEAEQVVGLILASPAFQRC